MADPLSISASVAGLLSLAIQVSQLLYAQIQTTKHAPRDAKELLDELKAIEGVLKRLDAFLREQNIDARNFGATSMLAEAIQGCTVKILDMQGRVEKLNEHSVGGLVERGKWYYKQDERREIVAHLHRSLTIFQLSLSVEGMGLILTSIQGFAEDTKAVYSAIQLLSQKSLDKKDFDKQTSRVKELIVPLYETATIVQRLDSKMQEKITQELLDWLSPVNPTAKQVEILKRRQPRTGTWFTEHEIFKQWLEGDVNRLWCPGIHGAGKTVLTAVILDYLQREIVTDSVGLAFHFCTYNEQAVQNVTNILCCLARQLLRRQDSIPEDLAPLFSQHKEWNTRPSLEECRSLLVSLTARYTRSFIVVDALDETDERDGTRNKLIAELKRLSSAAQILVTSRHSTSDEEQFQPSAQIEIRAREADLVAYVEARMTEESRLSKHFRAEPSLAPLVLENVVKQAQGMFLLAQLHMDTIVRKQSRRDVKQAFKNLPRSLDNTYEDAMKRISEKEEEDVNLAMKVLSWISYAARPLHITELQHAIATDPSGEDFDSDAIIDQSILASVCGGLVSIDKQRSTVSLNHYTAKEYFEIHRDRIFPEGRINIARTCLAYLSLETLSNATLDELESSTGNSKVKVTLGTLKTLFSESPREMELSTGEFGTLRTLLRESPFGMRISTGERKIRDILTGYPLLIYAIQHWGTHVKGGIEQVLIREIHKFLSHNGGLISHFYKSTNMGRLSTYPRDSPDDHTMKTDIFVLLAVAEFGLQTTMEYLLEKKNSKELYGSNSLEKTDYLAEMVAFEAATLEENEPVARLILRKRPGSINATDRSGETMFYKISVTNNWMAMRLLVEKKADVNKQSRAQGRKGETALAAAARRRSDDLVTWLLENGADDTMNETENTALVAFVSTRDLPNAKRLLELGLHSERLDAKSKARYLLMGIVAAAKVADNSILEMLFDVVYDEDSAADVALFDIFDAEGITSPLHAAAQSGHVSTARLLIEKGLPIDGMTESGWTPLHWAAERGNLDVLLYLLEEGASVDLQTAGGKWAAGQTALHKAAAKRNYTDVVAALLSFKASVTARMHNGNTALHIAAEKGNCEVVSVLLRHTFPGADSVNEKGFTARDLAVYNGHDEVVKIMNIAQFRPWIWEKRT